MKIAKRAFFSVSVTTQTIVLTVSNVKRVLSGAALAFLTLIEYVGLN